MDLKRFRPILALAAITGLLACEAEEAPEAADEVPGSEPATETTPAAPAPEPAPTAPAASATLDVASTPEYGPHLTDAIGRALYLLEADSAGNSTCYDACAEMWPPLVASQDMPTPGDAAVQPGLIGTLQRRDGSTQVTYNDHPLYYYSRDAAPGQVTGQDYTDEWGEWYLVTPQGEELEDN